ncbi:uncharacterized protein DUF5109 [Paenibacillus taihuensis]|uniref:Uncharacterized protein DUF5109 n=1 Tax=Paenibacillus taihuensis TaxID=1156355 RepID=A0A3D9Q3Z3_9BACL|nr:DUF4434 domain-containing protein [Paenibacillus taihuensis]REE55453.1 uncharacterized protein DUF5109 [Paenibacillus taihuensis]
MANKSIMPISGTWFDFHHPNPYEGDHWNATTDQFQAGDWELKITEMVEAGMDTLILMSVALHGKTFYPSEVIKYRWNLVCPDPLEVVLRVADRLGVTVYLGLGFFQTPIMHGFASGGDSTRYRFDFATELSERYGHHPSFKGWYFPVEAAIEQYYPEPYLEYVNTLANHCRKKGPQQVLLAPFGTRTIKPDDHFVHQLRALDADYIAYQDEVGVNKTIVAELDEIYSGLREAHDRAGKPLWADVEIFKFHGKVLHPAPFERVKGQLEVASKYVDKILCYQYLGMLNKPDSAAHAGHPDSPKLYRDYMDFIRANRTN